MVFYRKYRPQKISELDSEEVRAALSTVLGGRQVPHAFLFTGPRGLGKTSSARIVAKVVNCEKLATSNWQLASSSRKARSQQPGASSHSIEPCNKCSQCVSITNGGNVDVLEIDAASNRGIDEIRDLREKIKLAPAAASYKVYIIDEVHMLTTEAFNALLKMLEEPPTHVLFILCTTDPHKIPATIVSRCFHVGFKRASIDELAHSLARIAKKENITIDKDGLLELAKAADGSFRDGAKFLELAHLSAGRKKITRQMVLGILGNTIQSDDFISLLWQKDPKGALAWLSQAIEKGLNVKVWIEDFVLDLHSGLLSRYGMKNGQERDDVGKFSEEELRFLLTLFTRAHQEMRTAVIPQLPAEIAIIEYCQSDK